MTSSNLNHRGSIQLESPYFEANDRIWESMGSGQ